MKHKAVSVVFLILGILAFALVNCGEMPGERLQREQTQEDARYAARSADKSDPNYSRFCEAFAAADPIERERSVWIQEFCEREAKR